MLVQPDHSDLTLRRQCELLGLARASLYYQPTEVSAEERALQAGQAALGRLLAARAVTGLPGGAPDFVRLALSGEDLADAARKLHYLTYVSREAARMLETHRAALAEVAQLKADSEEKARELAQIEARGRADRERLLKERREHRRLLERIAGEIRNAKKKIQVLLADEARLARLVQEIGKVLAARPGAGYARVTSVPGASRNYLGGVVSYATPMPRRLRGIGALPGCAGGLT